MADDVKSREEIVKFALNELKKTMDAIKEGKPPTVSTDLKKIMQMLNNASAANKGKMSEDELNSVIKQAAKKVSKDSK